MDKNTPLADLPLDQVLAPLDGDSPTGQAVELGSFSSPLYQIKSARDDAEAAEKSLQSWRVGETSDEDHERDWKAPNWWPVVEESLQLLTTTSKDIRAASWLAEGLIRLHGVAGMRKGLELIWELCQQYWDQLHPRPDEEDGHTNATAGLRRLFGDLGIAALGEIVFVRSTGDSNNEKPRAVTFDQFRFTDEFDKLENEDTRSLRQGRLGWLSTAEFTAIAKRTPLETMQQIVTDLDQSVELLYKLGSFLRENCQPTRFDESTAPDSELLKFRQRVEWMQGVAAQIYKDLGGGQTTALSEVAEGGAGGEQAGGEMVVVGGQAPLQPSNPATREEAIRRIEQIADFFEQQEPHSPVHFGLRQIAKWGRMSLPELLKELLEDDGARASFSKRVGIPKDSSKD